MNTIYWEVKEMSMTDFRVNAKETTHNQFVLKSRFQASVQLRASFWRGWNEPLDSISPSFFPVFASFQIVSQLRGTVHTEISHKLQSVKLEAFMGELTAVVEKHLTYNFILKYSISLVCSMARECVAYTSLMPYSQDLPGCQQ